MDFFANTREVKWAKRYFLASRISFFLVLFALCINFYRFELFGVIHGYAPYEFAFNFLFFISVAFISVIIQFCTLFETIKNWKKWKNFSWKIWCLVFSSPTAYLILVILEKILHNIFL